MPPRPPLRMTHTYALLEVSAAAYDEIRKKLEAAEYDHLLEDDKIVLQGIALTREAETPQREFGMAVKVEDERVRIMFTEPVGWFNLAPLFALEFGKQLIAAGLELLTPKPAPGPKCELCDDPAAEGSNLCPLHALEHTPPAGAMKS